MAEDKKNAVELLAEFLSEGEVGFHSAGLGMPESTSHHKRAKRFFELRKAFGVEGYADKAEAEKAIRRALQDA